MKMTSDSGESFNNQIKMKIKTMNYENIDWKTCHEKLTVLQARLVEAHRAKNARGIKDLQRSIVTSFAFFLEHWQ
jgi:hypothetical protein